MHAIAILLFRRWDIFSFRWWRSQFSLLLVNKYPITSSLSYWSIIFLKLAWITITFFGESTKFVFDKDTNSSLTETVPRLPFKSFYPWDASSGLLYVITFAIQIYYLLFSITHANLWDVLFCSWLIFACEQLQHLKNILVPLVDLSSTLDTFRPNSAKFLRNFAIPESKSEDLLIEGNIFRSKKRCNFL